MRSLWRQADLLIAADPPIASFSHRALQWDATRRSGRSRRDGARSGKIHPVFGANDGEYGARKVGDTWRVNAPRRFRAAATDL